MGNSRLAPVIPIRPDVPAPEVVMVSRPRAALPPVRRPGYGLEFDLEQVLRDHFDVPDYASETPVFEAHHFGDAADEVLDVLRKHGLLPPF